MNIKILLGDVMASGEMTLKQRNNLLDEMTDEVAELVLDNNRAQTLALMIARQQSLPMVNVHARYLDQLEREGWLDRALEFLPSDKQIAERQSTGAGLSTPEFAVLIAYTKNANVIEIMKTDLPDNRGARGRPRRVLPECRCGNDSVARSCNTGCGARSSATQFVNQMVNLSGISYDHRMTEDTGASVTDVARAWVVVREVLDFPAWWDEIGRARPTSHSTISSSCTSTAAAPPNAARCGSSGTAGHRSTSASRSTASVSPVQALAAELSDCLRADVARTKWRR